MTSDAKIGLLLGLVFIFIIAFIINGLPSFHGNANSSELTVSMVRAQNTPPGLAARERKISREVIDESIRFKAPLPKSVSVAKTKPTIAVGSLPAANKTNDKRIRTSKSALPKVYVVGEGESLASIAKKVYGPDEGNKKATIARIFGANRKLLKSPDRVYPGQELVIPALSGSAQVRNKNKTEPFGAISASIKSVSNKLNKTRRSKAKQNRFYVVKAGDSLWRIAEAKLGNGARYSEIAELNAGIITDEDTLVVGMRLKLPNR